MSQASKTSTFRLTAAASRWTGARLGGLPKGGTLSVQLTTTGQITICLLDIDGYERLPAVRSPILSAETANDYAFTVVIPEAGDYFLVADNRDGAETRHLEVSVTASAPSQGLDRADVINIATTLLNVVEKAMHLVFHLEPLDNSSSGVQDSAKSSGLRLSHNYSEAVFQTVRDQQMSSNILLFTLFQDVANRLMQRQNEAISDDKVDELAVALSVMFGYTDRMRSQASYLAKTPADQEIAMILGARDDRVLNKERAEHALKWLDDPTLLRQWAPVFLANMQTTVLEGFLKETPAWAAKEEVVSVLTDRAES